jgi:integrase
MPRIQHTKDGRHLYQRIEGGTISFRIRGRDGKMVVESLHTKNPAEARIERNKRLVKLAEPEALPEPPKPAVKLHETVTVHELIEDYVEAQLDEQAAKLGVPKSKLSKDNAYSVLNLAQTIRKTGQHKIYKDRLAASITSANNSAYRKALLALGRSDATANNHLAYMRAAFYYGLEKQTPQKVVAVPYFPILPVDNARQGFVEFDGYEALLAAMPDSLKPFLLMAYHWGNRSNELKKLHWTQVDFGNKWIEVLPRNAKNKEGRYLPFFGDIEECLTKQWALKEADYKNCPFVLFWQKQDVMLGHGGLRTEPGGQLKNFYASWKDAVQRASKDRDDIPESLMPHDLRRSAVRNMVQEYDMTDPEAMEISGHKTLAMLRRYNIRSMKTVVKAGAALDAGFQKMRAKAQAKAKRST